MKRRLIGALLTTVACLTVSMSAFAADATQGQDISVTLTADPTYTVTIPSSVSMGNDGTSVEVTAADVKNLPEGGKISVTIAGTSAYRNQMLLEATPQTSPSTSIRYQIISNAGETIETNASTGAVGVGKEVVSFTEAGTKTYQILPVIAGRYETGVAYTGSITFGIEVAQ